MKRLIVLTLLLTCIYFGSKSQTVTKSFAGTVSGASCPGIGIQYEVTRPSGFTSCQITWSATNGIIPGPKNGTTAIVNWDDTPGATGTVTVTFSNCATGDSGNNGKTASFSELILSVKDQAWDTYGNLFNVDFCTTSQLYVTVPRMFVDGTGGFTGIPPQEVGYSWTLPAGWQVQGSGITGSTNTTTNYITIVPSTSPWYLVKKSITSCGSFTRS